MAKKFLTNLDLAKNQILNVALQNLASAPSAPVSGQIYFNTADARVYFWDGTTWVDISGDLRSVFGGAGLTATYSGDGDEVTLDVNVDNVTIEIDADTLRIKDLGVSTAKIADSAVTTVKINNNAVTLAKIAQIGSLTVLGNLSGATANVSEIAVVTDLASASSTSLATSSAIKSYIDANIGGLGNLEGGWDASSGSFPVGSSPVAGTKAGDYWYVTTAGTTGGVAFNVGDVIVAKTNGASTSSAADWIQLEVNRDQATTSTLGLVILATQSEVNAGTDAVKAVTPATLAGRTATESRTGIAEIATQTEVNDGTDDERIVTPLKLKTLLDNRTGGYATTISAAANGSYTVTHNLGTTDVTTNIYEVATGEEIITDVVIATTNTITVSFGNIASAGSYRVIVKK